MQKNAQENSATILLAEDNRFLRRAAEAILRRHGFTVLTAADGEEALKLAQSGAPDLILLDIMMPKINGFDVLRALKREPATSPIPVIVLSNLDQQNDVAAARELGAVGYWIKAGVGLEELVDRVKSLLEQPSPKS
jgi:CheY-like chemotaxis protein